MHPQNPNQRRFDKLSSVCQISPRKKSLIFIFENTADDETNFPDLNFKVKNLGEVKRNFLYNGSSRISLHYNKKILEANFVSWNWKCSKIKQFLQWQAGSPDWMECNFGSFHLLPSETTEKDQVYQTFKTFIGIIILSNYFQVHVSETRM